jgi:hypothetical protein
MKHILLLISLLFVFACGDNGSSGGGGAADPNAQIYSANAKAALQKTFVVGASISNSFAAESPGEKAARIVGTLGNLTKKAVNGAKGLDLLPTVTVPEGTTTMVGVDLFFWDSTLKNCGPSSEAMAQLIQATKARGINLVLGNIPPMMANQQTCMTALNAALQQNCTRQNQCYILDITTLFVSLAKGGTVTHKGRVYALKDLMADQLHVNEVGSEILATRILDLLR